MEDQWIGVDLDGTLAHVDSTTPWDGLSIGDPVPGMVDRLKRWLSLGIPFKIFTTNTVRHSKED